MDRSMIPSVVKDSIGGGSLNHKGLIAACLLEMYPTNKVLSVVKMTKKKEGKGLI